MIPFLEVKDLLLILYKNYTAMHTYLRALHSDALAIFF